MLRLPKLINYYTQFVSRILKLTHRSHLSRCSNIQQPFCCMWTTVLECLFLQNRFSGHKIDRCFYKMEKVSRMLKCTALNTEQCTNSVVKRFKWRELWRLFDAWKRNKLTELPTETLSVLRCLSTQCHQNHVHFKNRGTYLSSFEGMSYAIDKSVRYDTIL
jgi:hypothetical protein